MIADALPVFAEGIEKSVLSSCLKSETIFRRALAEGLVEEHFHSPARRRLFAVMAARQAAGLPNELVEFTQAMSDAGELEGIGGPATLGEIYTHAPNEQHFGRHFRILREKRAHRILLEACGEVAAAGSGMETSAALARMRQALEIAAKEAAPESPTVTGSEAAREVRAEMQAMDSTGAELPGLATGIGPLDLITGGMRAGEFWVIGGQTSAGKSVMMLQAAANALAMGERVMVISLEMQASDIVRRNIANLRTVPLQTFRMPGSAGDESRRRAGAGLDEFEGEMGKRLVIDEAGGRSLELIENLVQSEIDRNGPLGLVVVDYLQIVTARPVKGRSREQEIAEISRGMKTMAKRHRLPVFAGSQLNDDGRLRESRAVGHDADVVLLIEADGIRGAKVRNGPRDQLFPVRLNGEFQRFEKTSPGARHEH